MERDARDRFDHTGMTSASEPDETDEPPQSGETSVTAHPDSTDEPPEQGTDPAVVGDRDEPDLPVRTATDQPENAGTLPLGESDIEDRLRAAERVEHRDVGEPDAAFG